MKVQVHAMCPVLVDSAIEDVSLVDATKKAYNSINRKAALHNTQIIRASLSKILVNIYHALVRCVIPGSGRDSSSKVTMQEDSLAMAIYPLAINPLISEDIPKGKERHFCFT